MPPLLATKDLWDGSSRLLGKLKGYYVKEAEKPPAISERTALLCIIFYTILYIAPFYLSPTLRISPFTSRDAPSVIRARVRAVGLTCTACTAITVYILAIQGQATPHEVLRLLGLWPIDPLDCLKTLLLANILFVAPLFETLIVDDEWRDLLRPSNLKASLFDSWTGYRNLIIAPISEELVFRSLAISLYLLARVSPVRIVFITPLIFGIAHLHHLKEFLSSRTPENRRLPPLNVLLQGIVRSLFQFAYTSLFGFFAAFVFLRTGNLYAVVIVHAFCNAMGLPRFWGRVGQHYDFPSGVTPDVAQGKRQDEAVDGHVHVGTGMMQTVDEDAMNATQMVPRNAGVAWTVAYYILLVLGSLGFYMLLWPLTQSGNGLATF